MVAVAGRGLEPVAAVGTRRAADIAPVAERVAHIVLALAGCIAVAGAVHIAVGLVVGNL